MKHTYIVKIYEVHIASHQIETDDTMTRGEAIQEAINYGVNDVDFEYSYTMEDGRHSVVELHDDGRRTKVQELK